MAWIGDASRVRVWQVEVRRGTEWQGSYGNSHTASCLLRGAVSHYGGKPLAQLITLEEAKADLRVDHAFDDAKIEMLIKGCSGSILNYLKSRKAAFWDSATDSLISGKTVPGEVKTACALYVSMLYENDSLREQESVLEYGYLPRSVSMFLFQLRDPEVK